MQFISVRAAKGSSGSFYPSFYFQGVWNFSSLFPKTFDYRYTWQLPAGQLLSNQRTWQIPTIQVCRSLDALLPSVGLPISTCSFGRKFRLLLLPSRNDEAPPCLLPYHNFWKYGMRWLLGSFSVRRDKIEKSTWHFNLEKKNPGKRARAGGSWRNCLLLYASLRFGSWRSQGLIKRHLDWKFSDVGQRARERERVLDLIDNELIVPQDYRFPNLSPSVWDLIKFPWFGVLISFTSTTSANSSFFLWISCYQVYQETC